MPSVVHSLGDQVSYIPDSVTASIMTLFLPPFLQPISLASRPWSRAKSTLSMPPALLLRPFIHSFFRTFDIGIPRTDRSEANPEMIVYAEPLFNIMPALVEHFYQVLHKLSIYSHTSNFVMHYLRTRENFSACQVQYSDGSRVTTSVAVSSPSLPSFNCNPTSSTLLHWTFTRSLIVATPRTSQLLKLAYRNEQAKVIPAYKVEEEEHWCLWWGSYTKGSR
ncbi:hypothetical protein H4582DRAFT_2082956 [Lactarius indigo]|nr:hypothetical protein H4582DRAFT_2082956 [Lactarius indigo]